MLFNVLPYYLSKRERNWYVISEAYRTTLLLVWRTNSYAHSRPSMAWLYVQSKARASKVDTVRIHRVRLLRQILRLVGPHVTATLSSAQQTGLMQHSAYLPIFRTAVHPWKCTGIYGVAPAYQQKFRVPAENI